MRFDVAGLTEEDVLAMDEAAVLDLDDAAYYDLPERLNALPPDRLVATYASCLADLRDHYGSYSEEEADLISSTIGLTSGEDARALLAAWDRYIGVDDDLDVVGDEIDGLEYACIVLTSYLASEQTQPLETQALAEAAVQAIDDFEAGVNIRWLLRFNIRAERARSH